MARELDLDDIFLRLAVLFDQYRCGLNLMRRQLMAV